MLHLLGTPAIVRGGRHVPGLPAIAYTMAALLKLEYGDRAERAQLAAFLFENVADKNAGSHLRVNLSRIRKWEARHDARVFDMSGTLVAVADDCEPSDLERFLAINQVRNETDLDVLIHVYRGDLLAGFDPPGSDLRGWLAVQRTRLRDRFVRLIEDAAGGLSGPAAARARHILWEMTRDESAAPAVPTVTTPLAPTTTVTSPGIIRVPKIAVGMPAAGPTQAGLIGTALAEEVTFALCQLRSVATIAPHTMRKLSPGDRVIEDAAVLDVDYIVSTHAEGSDDRLIFRLAIIRRQTGVMIWTTRLPLSAAQVHKMRLPLAGMIAGAILEAVEHFEIMQGEAVERVAYLHYLHGRKSLRRLDLAHIRRAKNVLRDCTMLAKEFAPAYALLARAHSLEWVLLGRLERDLLEQAHALARKAVDIDPLDASGHRELARVSLFLHGTEESLHHYRAAEALAPHNADILADSADTLVHHSDIEGAHERMEIALQLNPMAPDEYRWTAGAIRFLRGEFGSALAMLRSMREPDPAARLMAAAAAMAGKAESAAHYREMELSAHPGFTIADWLTVVPLKDRRHIDLYVEGLRKAGFR